MSMPMTSMKLVYCVFCDLKPKPSCCILHHVHIFYDERAHLFLQHLPRSTDKHCNWILYHHNKTPSQISLRCLNLPPEQITFVLPPVHLTSLSWLWGSQVVNHIVNPSFSSKNNDLPVIPLYWTLLYTKCHIDPASSPLFFFGSCNMIFTLWCFPMTSKSISFVRLTSFLCVCYHYNLHAKYKAVLVTNSVLLFISFCV